MGSVFWSSCLIMCTHWLFISDLSNKCTTQGNNVLTDITLYRLDFTFGPEFLLKLYLAGAIGGSIFYLVHHAFLAASLKNQPFGIMDASKAPGLGASGAVNAIMLLDIFLHSTATLYFDFIIPVPAMLLGIFLIGKDILRIMEGNSQISKSAHLGGAAAATIAWARLRKGHGLFYMSLEIT
ncbi:RHOMBOID-like protein 12, mitochondrial [Rosa chinensis]|uniref:RHOMBOID-like protein 12, mitochondrial n=1 Tax=Rosa chinensis TaxID=74649 RepID=UPI001AD90D53|nr:RHOMBOID-like protein 12, mitochondrial [Rosa chinensis]